MKPQLTFALILLCSSVIVSAQTGPGGVGSSTDNILWLKADGITGISDGGAITTWHDTSGNNNDMTQTTAGQRPVWDQVNNNFNGKPTVHFDGTDDWFDYGNGQMNAASNYTILFVYKSGSTSTQHLLDTKTGKLTIPHEGGTAGGSDKAYHDGGGRGTEITGTETKMVVWWLNDAGASIYELGTQTQSGLSYTQRAINVSTSLGADEKGTGYYMNGDIAEAIIYNTTLNTAQRRIVENYLAAKYGMTITNDYYAYEGLSGYDVAGIGRVDASNTHTTAESAKLLRVSNPGSLEDGEFLLFGHGNGNYSSWTTSEIPGTNLQRIAREWRIDQNGDVGTVTVSLDTSLLAAKPSGYNRYVMWVDSDGNFSSGATQYVLTLNAGRYEKTGLTIPDGSYVSFGIMKPEIKFSFTSSFGSESVSPVAVQVALNYAINSNTIIDYVVTGGTSTGGGTDYTRTDSTVTIIAGTITQSFNIAINNDTIEESDETIIIKLRNAPSGITLGADSTYTYTINDNDASRKIQFQSNEASNPEDSTSYNVKIVLDLVDAIDTTSVDYTVAGGSATGSGTDFTLANGTAKIPPSDTITSFNISINNDALNEDDEIILIILSNSSANANVGVKDSFTYTITDNDPVPAVSFQSTSSEDSEGNTNPTITVMLDAASGKAISIEYSVTGGTATGGGVDYTLTSGTLNIAAGDTTDNITIAINDDSDIETDETITLHIFNPTNASLGADSLHTFTIEDDDNLGSDGPGGVGDAGSNILWLRADQITGVSDGAGIATWSDVSGNGDNATQGTPANQPTYDAVNVDFNNLSSVHFNGTSQRFLLSTLTHSASDFSFVTVYKTTSTSTQFLFDTQTGTIELKHEGGGGGGAYSDGAKQGSEITGTATQMVNWELDNAGSAIYINGATNQSGLSYTQQAIGGNTRLGSNDAGTGSYFNGDIAEFVVFDKKLNSAQRVIVENYLGAKYNLTISNDKYAYQAAHGRDVSGIGSDGLPNVHTAATSAGIVKISMPSSLDSGDYLMFGHDGGSVASWVSTETPFSEVTRIAREWRLDETGDVGTLTFTIDTTMLPARSGGYNGYVVMIDADGDFSNGATVYPLTLVSGSTYKADNINISDGQYITIGTGRYLSAVTGNFNATATWLGGAVPGSGQNAYVAVGTTVTLSANQTAGSVEVLTGGTLNIGSYTLSIDNGTITNGGTINFGTGSVNYARSGAQNIPALGYNNLILSGSGTKTLTGEVTINGNLTLTAATLDVDGAQNYSIVVRGNWVNSGGTFLAQNGTVTLGGFSDQQVTSGGSSFYNLIVSNSGTQITLNDNMTVANLLTLTDGVITTTASYRVIVSSNASTAVGGYSSASFVNGYLRRNITDNTDTYVFPVGNGTGGTNYYRADVMNNNLTGITYIESRFKPLTGHNDDSLDVADTWESGSLTYTTINTAGVWELEPNTAPSTGSYSVRLYIANMAGLTDNEFGPLKRPLGSTNGKDWETGGGTLNNNDSPGRTVTSGYMQRNSLTSFSEFGGGGGSGGGAGLPIQLLSFTATPSGSDVKIEWVTATEINNDFFTVERSQDAVNFETLGNFEAAGNSSETRYYSTNDYNPLPGTSYYRLKQTDFDGTFTYSNVVSVLIQGGPSSISVAPNPVTNRFLNIIVSGNSLDQFDSSTFTLSDLSGMFIFKGYIKEFNGSTYPLQLPDNISSGVYIARFKYADNFQTWKLVIE